MLLLSSCIVPIIVLHHVNGSSMLLVFGVYDVLPMAIDNLAHVGLVGDRQANNVAHL